MVKAKTLTNWLQATAVRITRIHFLLIGAYIASIIIFDSWNLFTHIEIGNRWTAAGILLAINTICWFVARIKYPSSVVYITLIMTIVLADIIFAAMNVYWERGLASKAVGLFAIPIVTAATIRSRSALLATASLCTAAYSTSAVRYYNLHYGESFRVELYGYVGFYCAMFFILSALLMVIISPQEKA
jgi:hypothetical protein